MKQGCSLSLFYLFPDFISRSKSQIIEVTKYAVAIAKQAGVLVSFYPNLRVSLWDYLDDAKEQILHFILDKGIDSLLKEDLHQMFKYSNAAASIITTRKGALRVMPSCEEIKQLVKEKVL